VFDSEGKFLTKWGTQGWDDGQFNSPTGIAVDNSGQVYVADRSNHRIQVFDQDGNFLTKWGAPGVGDMEFLYPSGVSISNSGEVYVADSLNHRIKVYRRIGGGSVDPANKQPTRWGYLRRSELYQNFPNPFNPDTWIPYQLAEDSDVSISIYNVSGRLVRKLNLGQRPAGKYLSKEKAAYWDGTNDAGEPVASDVYFYVMETGESYADVRKMVMVR
jgi:DNA-binding beta-propeller fold protein YncE